ncbi:MAG TPA: class I SAM-dependent methyltransferase [Opitutaceae bacterium]|jgi:SAM-dependent methyltransferase
MSTDQSYEHSAHYYDAVYGAVPTLGTDADFYENLARECGGPVLELGCGTGRVLLRIARHGIPCEGVDKSPAMLAQFKRKAGADAVTLHHSDMAPFHLGTRKFKLIFSAFRAFQHLESVEDQLACLTSVRAHLEPGGLFAFDVFAPKLESIAIDDAPEVMDVAFEYQGKSMRRYAKVDRDRARQLTLVTMRYEGDGPETVVKFSMRWFWRYELAHLLHRAGFAEVTIFGDFDRRPISRDTPTFVVLAR